MRFARTVPGELQTFLISSGFLDLGTWAGARPSMAIRMPGLSAREPEVLSLFADGLVNKEIATRLNVSPDTVKTHVARVLENWK